MENLTCIVLSSKVSWLIPAVNDLPAGPGVYCAINIKTGKYYIGSTKTIASRVRGHKSLLRKNRHHSKRLQNSWNKHGEDAFVWAVLQRVVDERDLLALEDKYLRDLRPYRSEYGYNLQPQATRVIHNEETRQIFREKFKGRTPWNKGKKMPLSAVEASRRTHTGRIKSESERKKLSIAMLGPSHPFRGKKQPASANQKRSEIWRMKPPAHGKYKGVHFDKRVGQYMARIYLNGKTKFLGRYDDARDAARAYDQAAIQAYGERCYLNNV